MLPEILGGALLAKALINPNANAKAKIEKKSQDGRVERYAVVYEVKQGKGNGSFGVSYLCSNREEADTWAKNACQVICGISEKFDSWARVTGVPVSGQIVERYDCWGESDKVIFCVCIY